MAAGHLLCAGLGGGCGGPRPAELAVEGPALVAYGTAPLPLPAVRIYGADGSTMSPPPTVRWSVEPSELGRLDGTGHFTPERAGEGQLVASLGALRDSLPLTVLIPDRIEIVGAASPQTLPVGRTLILTALVVSGGRAVDQVPLRWASSAPDIAAVRDGQLVGMRTGRARITVSGAGLAASIDVVITPERRSRRDPDGKLVAM